MLGRQGWGILSPIHLLDLGSKPKPNMRFFINPFTGDLAPYGNKSDSPRLQQNKSINFTYNTVSPLLLLTTQGNSRILEIVVGIEVAFDGSGWNLSIGDSGNPQSLIAPNQMGLEQADKFELSSSVFYSNPTQIYLYLTPGTTATSGSGFIYLLEV